jgi:hypothetical protein
MQLRQAASYLRRQPHCCTNRNETRFAHNTPAFPIPIRIPISPHPAKLPPDGVKCQGYTSEAFLLGFSGHFGLDILSALRFWCLSGKWDCS